MILDHPAQNEADLTADVVVIGAGAVGIFLAVQLARRGIKVIVLESGQRQFSSQAQSLNASESVGRHHEGITHGRARVLGGTTTLWGGQLVPFRDIDFESRPWIEAEAWPVSLDDMRPYYQEVAKILGLDSTGSDDMSVWKDLGIAPLALSRDFDLLLTRWLKEPNFYRYFREDLESNSNLLVHTGAACTSICVSEDGSSIDSVKVTAGDGREIKVRGRNFVVATGTIEASRLMLNSARLNDQASWKQNPWVGRSFQDHMDLRAARVQVKNKAEFSKNFDNIYVKGFKYQPKISLSVDAQKHLGSTNIAASFLFESSISNNIANIKHAIKSIRSGSRPDNLSTLFKDILAASKIWLPLIVRYIKDRRAYNALDGGVDLVLHCEQIPNAESSISLSATQTDHLGTPLPVLNWNIDGREINSMAMFCEELSRQFEGNGLATLSIDADLKARSPAILDKCKDTNHHCGGLRMSTDPARGVVDRQLTVHGTSNLSVAGAATFPSSSFANPTFTALALTLRLADHLEKAASCNK